MSSVCIANEKKTNLQEGQKRKIFSYFFLLHQIFTHVEQNKKNI